MFLYQVRTALSAQKDVNIFNGDKLDYKTFKNTFKICLDFFNTTPALLYLSDELLEFVLSLINSFQFSLKPNDVIVMSQMYMTGQVMHGPLYDINLQCNDFYLVLTR